MIDNDDGGTLADSVVPIIAADPTVSRTFTEAPWHRPRKQYIRKYQWNKEIVDLVLKKRRVADAKLRVFGLPSSEYLDLLSLQPVCEENRVSVHYLGFNAQHAAYGTNMAAGVNVYAELEEGRRLDSSSFVHPSSSLVPDRFELIRQSNSMSRRTLDRFEHFDVINLDICGSLTGVVVDGAGETLDAISELLRWQSTRRLTPWLLFVTSFASPTGLNVDACKPLAEAVSKNAQSENFRTTLESELGMPVAQLLSWFTQPNESEAPGDKFRGFFALAFGKWLLARLQLPDLKAVASLLPSYCFRNEGREEPQLISLAFFIEPTPPSGGPPGVGIENPSPGPSASPAHSRYESFALKFVKKAFDLRDLDRLLELDKAMNEEVANETEELLIGCGFDPAAVKAFIASYR